MPQQTRSAPRAVGAPRRAGRPDAGGGLRYATIPVRRGGSGRPTPRRFGIAGGVLQRRRPEPKGLKKVLVALPMVGGAGKAKTRAKPSRAKRGGAAGGIALMTAAAGILYTQRDKLKAKLGSDDREPRSTRPDGTTPPASAPGPSAATPPAANYDPGTSGGVPPVTP